MALLWDDKYKVGEEKIDAEHREWFRLANDFLDAGDRQTRDASGEAFSRYTRQHFIAEEALMQEILYPFIATHVGEHQRLFSTLSQILDVGVEGILSKIELEEFVGYTLRRHINAFDAPLSVYLKRSCMDQVM
jgi:hemerythrin-like metal-binding protein